MSAEKIDWIFWGSSSKNERKKTTTTKTTTTNEIYLQQQQPGRWFFPDALFSISKSQPSAGDKEYKNLRGNF